MDSTYSVVDMTRKKKRKKIDSLALPKKSVVESTSETPAVSAVVEKEEKAKSVPQSNIDVASDYSMIALTNLYPEAEQNSEDIIIKDEKVKGETNVKKQSKEFAKFACLLVTVTVMAVIMSVCFIAAFVEISKVKSAMHSSALQVSTENISAILLSTENISAILSAFSQLEDIHHSLNITLTNAVKQQENHSNMLYKNFTNLLNDTITEKLKNQENFVEMLYTELTTVATALSGISSVYPASSCADILLQAPSSPSGYYWIRSSNGSAVSVYCDMTRSCGDITGGWMRVAELDMTDSSSQCPSGLKLNDSNIRTCVGTNMPASCSSVIFHTTIVYSMVCGKIIAYQVGTPNAFEMKMPGDYRGEIRNSSDIDTYYVDGVSLTHGSSPRQHIWTFAAAPDEVNTDNASNCPCFSNSNTTNPPATSPPDYVGVDYFCDTGSQKSVNETVFYREDPLWDGAGCGGHNACCSFNNPPWFYKQLSQPTTDDIEMRVCRDEDASNEDIVIESIELYVR